MTAPIVECRNVVKHYRRGKEEVRALRGVSFTLDPGAFLCVAGRSGSGKTTLLSCVGMLDTVTSGEIFVEGMATGRLCERERNGIRKKRFGFVFQESRLFPFLSTLDNVALPLVYRGEGWGAARRRASASLEAVGLARLAEQPARWLSGGEAQRAAVARALVYEPALILADEPTGELDTENARAIIKLLAAQKEKGTALMVVSHDPLAREAADSVLQLEDGAPVT